jgi:hypothetical protein
MTNGTKRTSDQTFHICNNKAFGKKKLKKCKLNENYYFHDCGNIHLCVYVNTETGVVWGLRKGNIALVDVSDCQKSNINNIHILINHRKHHCLHCLSFFEYYIRETIYLVSQQAWESAIMKGSFTSFLVFISYL